MNHKFSIKIAALLATFTGTAFGPTSLLPSEWLASAYAQPPIVSPDQAQPGGKSKMLTPLAPPVVKPSEAMPWKVDRSKYQSAIDPSARNRPAIVKPAPVRKNTATAPTVQQAVGQESDNAKSSVQPAAAQMTAPVQGRVPSGFSSAGIPLYSSPPAMANRSTAPQARLANAAAGAVRSFQGSGTRNVIGSGIQSDPMMTAPAMEAMQTGEFYAPPSMPAPPVISPGSEMIMGDPGGSMMNVQPGTMPSVMNDGSVMMPETIYSDSGYVADPIVADGGCNTCNATGAAGCESGGDCNCGPGGCYNAADIAGKAGLYGSVGEARYYSHLEAMVMDRQDGDVVFTDTLRLGGFDADYGYRFTFGERLDAINGREISYWGTGQISNSATLTGGSLPQVFQTTAENRAQIAPFGFFTEGTAAVAGVLPRAEDVFGPDDPGFAGSPPVAAIPSTLIRPTTQSHSKETYFHTVEMNKVRWGWDVFKSFAGLRYIYVNDSYELNSQIGDVTSGMYKNLAQNNLIGPHIGAEWFYDVGYRLSASVSLKGGIYANLNEVDTRLITPGTIAIDNEAENTAFSSSLEFGIHAHYQIAPRGRFRAGFNILHLEDVATVTQNFPAFVEDVDGASIVRSIGRGTGTGAFDDDDLTFTGFSFGLEFFR